VDGTEFWWVGSLAIDHPSKLQLPEAYKQTLPTKSGNISG